MVADIVWFAYHIIVFVLFIVIELAKIIKWYTSSSIKFKSLLEFQLQQTEWKKQTNKWYETNIITQWELNSAQNFTVQSYDKSSSMWALRWMLDKYVWKHLKNENYCKRFTRFVMISLNIYVKLFNNTSNCALSVIRLWFLSFSRLQWKNEKNGEKTYVYCIGNTICSLIFMQNLVYA